MDFNNYSCRESLSANILEKRLLNTWKNSPQGIQENDFHSTFTFLLENSLILGNYSLVSSGHLIR